MPILKFNRRFNAIYLAALLSVLKWDLYYAGQCPRDQSRSVRKVLEHHMEEFLQGDADALPRSCPFHIHRDMYHDHESHKIEESYGKWYCNYCGKSFYAESFLDNHFSRRHPQHVYTGPDSVCLADYCDIFRCDVISGRVDPTFWDTALCIEDDMVELATDCQEVFKRCFTEKLNSGPVFEAINKTMSMVCSSLTCSRYWFTGKVEENQWLMLLKTFCTVFLIGSLIIYYFLAYHHFFSESLFLDNPVPQRHGSLFEAEYYPKPYKRKRLRHPPPI
ncbi:uncharacterized protein LOC127844170 isoform X5 [Dreissena polymorpha]|uniref:C2H2-type domain-containing protein n=1 Tax=Dreissena polymorpha TaxID=45954 RepID=A0A9D4IEM0_DREPO|nr:uncharacterized protein LOC127844170 isoform X5 [Dreissena polymorpha]XP_052230187.1 uncharacterized protein LOC127844170 isoform X5 [Dreissena polymorpha]KAH3769567.1 hypothetical protein DPMN_170840 [Dreissena polymorpha]